MRGSTLWDLIEAAEIDARQSHDRYLYLSWSHPGTTEFVGSTARINVTSRVMFSVYENVNTGIVLQDLCQRDGNCGEAGQAGFG